MGLLYPFPISKNEKDFVIIDQESSLVTLKSYGLPYIFWIYALASFIVYFFMMLGIKSTWLALFHSEDSINQALAMAFLIFAFMLPLGVLFFFFYQKMIISDLKKKTLTLKSRIFGLVFYQKQITLNKTTLEISRYLDSPNQARIEQKKEMRGFQNKGYFTLKAIGPKGETLIDRSSNKSDLIKIKKLLLGEN